MGYYFLPAKVRDLGSTRARSWPYQPTNYRHEVAGHGQGSYFEIESMDMAEVFCKTYLGLKQVTINPSASYGAEMQVIDGIYEKPVDEPAEVGNEQATASDADRARYVQAVQSGITNRLAEAQRRKAESMQILRDFQARTQQQLNALVDYEADIKRLSSIEDMTEMAEQQFEVIRNMEGVVKVEVQERGQSHWLVATTAVLSIEDIPISDFQLSCDLTGRGYMQIKALDMLSEDGEYGHPHILGDSSVCWGNAFSPIEEAIAERRFPAAIASTLAFLQTWNGASPYADLKLWEARNAGREADRVRAVRQQQTQRAQAPLPEWVAGGWNPSTVPVSLGHKHRCGCISYRNGSMSSTACDVYHGSTGNATLWDAVRASATRYWRRHPAPAWLPICGWVPLRTGQQQDCGCLVYPNGISTLGCRYVSVHARAIQAVEDCSSCVEHLRNIRAAA